MSDSAPSPLRRSLWPFAFVYRAITSIRNRCYDSGLFEAHSIGVPVVSVGNLTVGGTGKTPLVCWLVAAARHAGRRPGVLARGYGRASPTELNDEGQLLAARFPDLPQVQDPDRVAGGRRLVAEHDVDLVVLDDGFQHRRLARDVDVVCLDAERPFAHGAVLPAGDLREGARAGLRRATVVVLTRADRLGDAVDTRREQIREFARRADLPVFACAHAPSATVRLDDGGAVDLRGRRALLVSAIARPATFASTVSDLGGEVVDEVRFRDHHRYVAADVERIAARAAELDAVVVTTEKDAVKLRAFDLDAVVVRIDLEWIGPAPTLDQLGVA